MEVTAWVYAVASSSEEEDELEEDLQDLLTTNEVITSTCPEEIVPVNLYTALYLMTNNRGCQGFRV